jgi:hypothetical protein
LSAAGLCSSQLAWEGIGRRRPRHSSGPARRPPFLFGLRQRVLRARECGWQRAAISGRPPCAHQHAPGAQQLPGRQRDLLGAAADGDRASATWTAAAACGSGVDLGPCWVYSVAAVGLAAPFFHHRCLPAHEALLCQHAACAGVCVRVCVFLVPDPPRPPQGPAQPPTGLTPHPAGLAPGPPAPSWRRAPALSFATPTHGVLLPCVPFCLDPRTCLTAARVLPTTGSGCAPARFLLSPRCGGSHPTRGFISGRGNF